MYFRYYSCVFNTKKLLIFVLGFFWTLPIAAFFDDEIDFIPLADDKSAVLMLELGGLQSGWDFLHDSQISSVTTLDKIKQETLFTAFTLNDRWDFGFKFNHSEGSVDRTVQPLRIDTTGKEFRVWLGSDANELWQWRGYYEQQKADSLELQCYTLNNLTIGGKCPEAQFIFRDALNPNPDDSLPTLPLVKLQAKSKVVGVEFRRTLIASPTISLSAQLRIQAANILSEQNSPLFNLQSPVLLGLVVGNQTLESLREDLRMQLPQDKDWYEYNLTLGLSGAWVINANWSLLAGAAYSSIERNDYQERTGIKEVKDNFRLDAGILWSPIEGLGIYFKGFTTTHNTLGYEPIAYNRRTSSTFDNKYGELSLGFIKTW